MESIGKVWSTLDTQRKFFVVVAVAAVIGTVLMLAKGTNTRDLSLLFGGLEAQAAGDVITALDQQGVPYEVRGNAIYVPSGQRDILRMGLAGQGLPANGNQGYEILDSLSGFSTTAQMFDAAYWRAKEGELARTILASPHIRSARVHISTPSTRSFQRDQIQTAAVTVTTTGGALSVPHVRALQFLISAAVPGLDPTSVAIIDDSGGLISDGENGSYATSSNDQAEALRLRAERLLAARVGTGNAVVEVSVETVTETEQIIERRVDPDSRIAISTDVTESSGAATDSRGGDVTVASNLPDGDAAGANGASSNENSESRTLTNYEVSETQRELVRSPGAVKRLTVAVLVNDITVTDPDGSIATAPRSEEELNSLQELVASAVGIDAARGDILTIKSMQFEPIIPLGSEAAVPIAGVPLDLMQLIQIGVLAVVTLILGLFVVRPILTSAPRPSAPLAIEDALQSSDMTPPMAIAMTDDPMGSFISDEQSMIDTQSDDPVTRLRQMITDREPETIQILQDWIEEPSAKATA